jgi:Allene oxide cyclase barrel like domain
MRRRLRSAAAAVAATALIVPSVALATRGGGHGHGKTFTLNAVQTADQFLDLGGTGLTSGDQSIFATAVSRDGHPEGVAGGSCTITTVDSSTTFTASCQATARLRGGMITTQALVTFGEGLQPPFTLAITGGTGQYRGAAGEVEVRQISDTTEDYIVRLDRR